MLRGRWCSLCSATDSRLASAGAKDSTACFRTTTTDCSSTQLAMLFLRLGMLLMRGDGEVCLGDSQILKQEQV